MSAPMTSLPALTYEQIVGGRVARIERQVEAWMAHAEEAHGEDDLFPMYHASLHGTYIECCRKGCKWTREDRQP